MSSGDACLNRVWEDTIFSGVFDGFTLEHYMEGSIPECIFTGLPNLQTLVISGNGFTADLPSYISTSFVVFDAAHNKITGNLPINLAYTNITSLDLSFNRIRGTLESFINWDLTYTNAITLTNNRLSGDLPASLQYVDDVQLLSGNLFECGDSKEGLPLNDPVRAKYECGSNNVNRLIFQFAGGVIVLIILFVWTKWIFPSYDIEQKQWLQPFEDTDILEPKLQSKSILHNQLKRHQSIIEYGKTLLRFKRFIAKIGIFVFVLFSIVYSSLSGNNDRALDNTYTYVMTAAYMLGTVSTTVLLVFFLVFMVVLRLVVSDPEDSYRNKIIENEKEEENEDEEKDSIEIESDSAWFWIIPSIRVFLIFAIINGVSVGTHIGYFLVLEYGNSGDISTYVQFLSIFNLFWHIYAFPWFFQNELFLFGLPKKLHMKFIDRIFGSELYLIFLVSSIAAFWVPIIIAAAVESSCINGIFVTPPVQAIPYLYKGCNEFFNNGSCANRYNVHSSFTVIAPFSYNYGCSSALLKAYIPVFMNQFFIKIALSVLQYIYLGLYTKYQITIETSYWST